MVRQNDKLSLLLVYFCGFVYFISTLFFTYEGWFGDMSRYGWENPARALAIIYITAALVYQLYKADQ